MTTGSSEQPDEVLDEAAPAGTPVQDQVAEQAADLWCVHGVRWSATADGWTAEDAPLPEHLGHDITAQVAGAIPETCQPTYGSREAWERNRVIARETERVVAEVLDEEGR